MSQVADTEESVSGENIVTSAGEVVLQIRHELHKHCYSVVDACLNFRVSSQVESKDLSRPNESNDLRTHLGDNGGAV